MEHLISQLGLNYNVNLPTTPIAQDLDMDAFDGCGLPDWVPPNPRPCKDILRQAIRVSRIKKGQVMPVIDKESTVPKKRKKPLQGEIPEDMLLRRQKNREAAKKCRLKKRIVKDMWKKKVEKYENLNRALENDIENFKEEKAKLQRLLEQHKCGKTITTQQHCRQIRAETSSVTQHEVPAEVPAVEDIAVSLDDLLSELQDDDRWCEELQNFM